MNTLASRSFLAGPSKVPEVTAFFWIIKMMSTTVGETGAHYLNVNLGLGLVNTSALTGLLLAIALFFQVRAKGYAPSFYWIAVLFISLFGTLITDNLGDQLGVPRPVSTAVFCVALIATFIVWYGREKTLSIRAIDTVGRELFYWTAILFTFALGTAAGDWVTQGLGLGYGKCALLFGGLIAVTAVARYAFRINAVACFWVAYVLTRPFGASCGDLLSQSGSHGGLGLGTASMSAIFLVVIVGLVLYLSLAQKRLMKF